MWKVTISTVLTIILVCAFVAIFLIVALYSTPAKGWVTGILDFVGGIGKWIDSVTPG